MKKTVKRILIMVLVFIVASAIGYIFQSIGFYDTNIVVVYLLAVLISAWLTRSFIYGFIASFLASFLFNYLFVDPIFAVFVNSPHYIITLIVMTFTALIANILTLHAKKSALIAIEKENEVVKERYRANLLRAISHDIRTPLSGMKGTAEMLLATTSPGMTSYELVRSIQNDIDWLHSMLENILSLTRLHDDKLTVNKQMEAVEEIVGSAVSQISAHNPERRIITNVPDKPLFVPMDAILIKQVIVNILDNAVKYTKTECEISIAVKFCRDISMAKFVISDTGTGIDEEDKTNILKKYYTSHKKNTDATKGIGLGLALCETIVKSHGGDIIARNRTSETGAEFTFTLPLEVKCDQT